jgi:hypothetical protein
MSAPPCYLFFFLFVILIIMTGDLGETLKIPYHNNILTDYDLVVNGVEMGKSVEFGLNFPDCPAI